MKFAYFSKARRRPRFPFTERREFLNFKLSLVEEPASNDTHTHTHTCDQENNIARTVGPVVSEFLGGQLALSAEKCPDSGTWSHSCHGRVTRWKLQSRNKVHGNYRRDGNDNYGVRHPYNLLNGSNECSKSVFGNGQVTRHVQRERERASRVFGISIT